MIRYYPAGTRSLFRRSPLVSGTGDRGDNQHLHPGRSLEDVAPVLGLYYRALSGRNAAILPDASEGDAERYPDTHTTIRLPARVARFVLGGDNVEWYKAALTHRAAHYAAGTFAFSFAADAAHFLRLRPRTIERSEGATDLEAFFRLFAERELAIDVFTVLEALRLDQWVKRRYPGLARKYALVQANALGERAGFLADRTPRDALAEVLIQTSLGATDAPVLPTLLHEPVRRLVAVCQKIAREGARAEDSAEATLRAYALIAAMPNLAADYGPASAVDLAAAVADGPWPGEWPESEKNRLEGEEVMRVRFAPVAYRDRLGSRITRYKAAGPLDQQSIYRFTQGGAADGEPARAVQAADADVSAPPEPLPHDHHDHFPGDEAAHETGELHSHEQHSYIHPEWDHYEQRYRRAWVRVRESTLDTTPSARFFDETLAAYGALVPGVRRSLERIAETGLRRVHRLPYGEEIDLDAAIASRVDARAGRAPDDNVYVARQAQARDVTLALVVDMSSSTAEHVAAEPAPAMRAALAKVHGRNYRTILDLEKEALVLLIAALEKIGDTYGIYFFSGTGREDVRFQVLKDLDERFCDTVAGRFEKLRPLHTTRMGAAIRHAVRKLRARESKTRLLLLVSDGRPFDLDYGQGHGEGAEIEYAIADTRQALLEARQARIKPFVLTIDPQGEDYLRAMCDGFDYEVLDDVAQLPARLVSLYQGLV